MIKINLKGQSQASGAFLGNFDISLINIPLLLGALLFTGAAPMFFESYFKGLRDDIQVEIDTINTQKKNYDKQLESLAEIDKKIAAMEAEEKSISTRIQVLQDRLKQKANPMKIMHYISEHIPKNIWITRIDIKNSQFVLEGNALDYDSIGKFVEALNLAIFFDKTVKLDDYRTKQSNDEATRLEGFKISGIIKRFE
jgi:Tfp pilus assembly protein PilN